MARRSDWRGVAARVAALPVIYAVTALATACAARLLPMTRVEATIAATISSFALFAILILVAFLVRSAVTLWLWLVGAGLALGGVLAASFHLASPA